MDGGLTLTTPTIHLILVDRRQAYAETKRMLDEKAVRTCTPSQRDLGQQSLKSLDQHIRIFLSVVPLHGEAYERLSIPARNGYLYLELVVQPASQHSPVARRQRKRRHLCKPHRRIWGKGRQSRQLTKLATDVADQLVT